MTEEKTEETQEETLGASYHDLVQETQDEPIPRVGDDEGEAKETKAPAGTAAPSHTKAKAADKDA
jgi:hypothetical protein